MCTAPGATACADMQGMVCSNCFEDEAHLLECPEYQAIRGRLNWGLHVGQQAAWTDRAVNGFCNNVFTAMQTHGRWAMAGP